MPEEIKTRNMLVIATNKTTGKGHYILKVGVHGKTIAKNAETLCGLIQPERVHKVLHITSPAIMDCKRCKQAFTKHEGAQLAKVQLEEVKMLQTSDGKTFPLTARTAALKHEDRLTSLKKEKEFIASVERVLFTDGDAFDEIATETFKQDVVDAIENNFEFGEAHEIGLETIDIEEFLRFFHEMLVKHGAKIRQMVILYQKVYGTLVPCRNTMENMKRGGNNIYL